MGCERSCRVDPVDDGLNGDAVEFGQFEDGPDVSDAEGHAYGLQGAVQAHSVVLRCRLH